MTYHDILANCELDAAVIEDIRSYLHNLEVINGLQYLDYPCHLEQLIKIMVQPNAILIVRSMYGDEDEPFLNRVLIYKNRMRCNFALGFPKEYELIKRLIEVIQ